MHVLLPSASNQNGPALFSFLIEHINTNTPCSSNSHKELKLMLKLILHKELKLMLLGNGFQFGGTTSTSRNFIPTNVEYHESSRSGHEGMEYRLKIHIAPSHQRVYTHHY